jgi:hypothetical protein
MIHLNMVVISKSVFETLDVNLIGNYMHHLFQQFVSAFCLQSVFVCFVRFSL